MSAPRPDAAEPTDAAPRRRRREQSAPRRLNKPRLPERHLLERPAVGLHATINIATILLAIFLIGYVILEQPEQIDDFTSTVIAALGVPIALLFIRGLRRAQPRIDGLPITVEQFPELHARIVDISRAAGLARTPRAYLTSVGGYEPCRVDKGARDIVLVSSDLYAECEHHGTPQVLDFAIAHEVGHVVAGHGNYSRMLATSWLLDVPIIGGLVSRPQEYTADRVAARIAPTDAIRALAAMAIGRDNYLRVSPEAMHREAFHRSGVFVVLANLLSGRPPVSWRMRAILPPYPRGRVLFPPRPDQHHL
ncbi:hypothetical protein EG850_03460 [Gulosibacter macacae]|uniref:Peptidase M48 domain-containing protein n=1 Tax=Gulosibacter macacae TaxID=2488791 RepID=A0A3P3VYY6_9MICO|nr:M48 family metalloprotease [Gulosibacter macacae]RRJ87920.1 hypothetical protein EG850_03460 [Gulosibacter macacae]